MRMELNSTFDTERSKKQHFTDVVGNFGKWQFIVCLHMWLMTIASVSQNMIITFHAPNINYHCSMPEDIKAYNVSGTEWVLHGIPRDEEGSLSSCTRYKNWDIGEPNRSIVQCNQWDYNTSTFTNTIINKFDLVCDRKWMISFLKSSFMFGYIPGGILCGFSDRFGRRTVILASWYLFLVCSLLSAFSSSPNILAVLRCFISVALITSGTVIFVLNNEIVGTKVRVHLSYLRAAAWSVGMLILVGTAYFIRDWFWLQITLSLPAVLIAISMWWFVPESPRFLLTHGYKDQASSLLKTAARCNGIAIDDEENVVKDLMESIQKDDSNPTRASFLDLFRTPELRKRSLLLHFAWFIITVVYYSVTYNTNRLHGDMYVNFTVSAVVEIPAILVFFVVSRYIGRRRSLFFSMTASGAALIISQIVPKGQQQIVLAFMMIGKGFIAGSVADGYLYTVEVLPTVVRAVGIGSCLTFGSLGGVMAPFCLGMGNIPMILVGIVCICSGFSLLVLPETHKKHITDTVKEATRFGS